MFRFCIDPVSAYLSYLDNGPNSAWESGKWQDTAPREGSRLGVLRRPSQAPRP